MPAMPFKPVYVLYGDDEYLRDEHRRQIVEEVVGSADAQLAVASFNADAELADVLDDLRTLPLMSPSRLVIVRDADSFVSAHRQALEDYLDHPSPTGALLLIVSSWPGNTNLAKRVLKIGRAIACSAPAGNLGQWIAQAALKRGKQIAPQAAQLLEQYVGADLAALDAEVEKLSLYVGDRPAIATEDVNVLTVATAGPADFALTNALTASDAKTAVTVLDKMLTRKGLEFMVLGQIGGHLRRAIKGQSIRQAGGDPREALNPYMPSDAKQKYLDLLRRRPLAVLQQDFRRVLAADLAMKSGAEPRAAMQDLVLSLCL
jgi:DNA polymerase-3 subunit delta